MRYRLAALTSAGELRFEPGADGLPERWNAVVIVEGERTTDGREIAPNAFTWRALPIPLLYSPTGDGHDSALVVGSIETIERRGAEGGKFEIVASGDFDLGSDVGREAARLVGERKLRWLSADTEPIDVELVQTGECDDDLIGGGEDCEVTYRVNKGRIMAATLVAKPAFPRAVIVPEGMAIPERTEDGAPEPVVASVVEVSDYLFRTDSGEVVDWSAVFADADAFEASDEFFVEVHALRAALGRDPTESETHESIYHGGRVEFVTDKPWNGSSARFTDDQWRRATAACRGESDAPKTDCFLPHHEPSGEVNRNGVHAAAGRHGSTKAPDAKKRRAAAHLRSHYRALRETPPRSIAASVSAALDTTVRETNGGPTDAPRYHTGGVVTRDVPPPGNGQAAPSRDALPTATVGGPKRPPAAWFANPQLEALTPLTITDDGRVFGHVAPWDGCHTGYSNECLRPPRSESGYAYFLTGEVVATGDTMEQRDGNGALTLTHVEEVRVPVGQLSIGAGHAPTNPNVSARAAIAHYDGGPGAVQWADVNVGDDAFGIWVAGAVRPDVDDAVIRAARATAPSGDWRPIRGGLELVAVTQVPVPGYPVPRALVAALHALGVELPESCPAPRARVVDGEVVALVAAGGIVRPEAGSDVGELRALVSSLVTRLERVERIASTAEPEYRAKLLAAIRGDRVVDRV